MSKKNKPSSAGEQQQGTPEQKNRPPQDIQDPRTKNSRHKKVTADKWNQ